MPPIPPPIYSFKTDTIEKGANVVGMGIPFSATTESPIKHIFYGGGYKAARGLISRDITSVPIRRKLLKEVKKNI